MRRVVCAAIRAEDGELLLGVRHYDYLMYLTINARADGAKFRDRHGDDQGFVDGNGVYMTRREAFVVACNATQLSKLWLMPPAEIRRVFVDRQLYSEHIY